MGGTATLAVEIFTNVAILLNFHRRRRKAIAMCLALIIATTYISKFGSVSGRALIDVTQHASLEVI